MIIKTSKDLVPSLRGSAFRRITCDGRYWFIRPIKTMRTLHIQDRTAETSLGQAHVNENHVRRLLAADNGPTTAQSRSIR